MVGCPVVDAEEGGESPPVGQVGIPTPADVPPECSGDDNHDHGESTVSCHSLSHHVAGVPEQVELLLQQAVLLPQPRPPGVTVALNI